jgi:antitoxin component YwqK of YwqJK toxin-antitoxin module
MKMNLKLLIILCVGLLIACGDNASDDVSTTKSKAPNKGQEDREYIKQSYREDGTLQGENYIENGDLIDRVYYTNGQIREEEVFKNFWKDNSQNRPNLTKHWTERQTRRWNQKGQLKDETILKLNGLSIERKWHINGQMWWEEYFSVDSSKSHKKAINTNMIHLQNDSLSRQWSSNGQLIFEYRFKAGKEMRCKHWDEDGNEIECD